MEVGVRVDAEDPITGTVSHCCSAYLTFVALDKDGNPKDIPDIVPETDVELRRYK